MSAVKTFEDASNPGVSLSRTDDYEIHTSSTFPNDFGGGGIVIMCYNHDLQSRYNLLWIKPQNAKDVQTFSCEFLRNLALSVCCNITPVASNLFHLFDKTRRWLVPLGKLVDTVSTSQSPTIFLLRMIWKPKDMMELRKVDPAALRYLYYQCHNDFVYGDIIEKVPPSQKTYESLLGLVIFDMVAYALNSEPKIGLRLLKRNYTANQFMSQRVLTDIEPTHHFPSLYQIFNKFRINLICRQNLGKHYRDFSSQVSNGDPLKSDGPLNVMLSYIVAICDKIVDYFTITGQLTEGRKVVIYHPQNDVFMEKSDGSKEKLFEISKLQRHGGICSPVALTMDDRSVQAYRLCLYVTKPDNDWERIELEFACIEEAYHFAAAIVSLYQSTVHYPCSELTNDVLLAPPSIMKWKSTGYHGPLSEYAATKLMNISSSRMGNYLLYQRSDRWQEFVLDAWNQKSEVNGRQQSNLTNELFRMQYSILLSEKFFHITGKTSENIAHVESLIFDSLSDHSGFIHKFRSCEKTIKEAILPSSKYRAGFPIGMDDKKEAKGNAENSICSQAHIIPSSEVEILRISDSKLGEGINTIVTKAVWRQKQIAVKLIKDSATDRLEMERLLQLSGSTYLTLKSPLLMEIYGFSVDGLSQYLLMEYCPLGKLSDFLIREKAQLKKKHLLSTQRQILKALEFLHTNGSYHGNLRCNNVLVSKFIDQIVVKLADPGINGNDKESLMTSYSRPLNEKARLDLRSYAFCLAQIYSVWNAIPINMSISPVHCPEELFESVIKRCWDNGKYPGLTATDVVKDLTIFEQGFNGGELYLFTSSAESDMNSSNHCVNDVSKPADVMIIYRHLIQYDEKNKTSVLGQGHYGQVFRGMYKGSIPCAIKKLRNCDSDSIEQNKELDQEFKVMSKLNHASIVKLFGRCLPFRNEEHSEPYLLVMEFMEGGCLLNYLRESAWKSNYNSNICVGWALQIAEGLCYLHSQGVVHRDLACRNVLLMKDRNCVKISDFGLSRLLNERNYYRCTPRRELPICWLAPESFPVSRNPQCNKASDLWSYGVVLWEIFSFGAKPQTAEPYHGLEIQQLYNLFHQTPPQRLQMPSNCPQIINDLVKECWNSNPSCRPSAGDVVQKLQSEY